MNRDDLQNISPMPRHARQEEIESRIVSLLPDACETSEILAALTASLTLRYGEEALEACLYATHLKKALERLDNGLQVKL